MAQNPPPDYSLTLLKSIKPVIKGLKTKFKMINQTKTLNKGLAESLECYALSILHVVISMLDQIFILQQTCEMEVDDDIQLKSHALRESILRKKKEFLEALKDDDEHQLRELLGEKYEQLFGQQNK